MEPNGTEPNITRMSNNSNININDDADSSRRDEINTFAAMATGGAMERSSSDTTTTTNNNNNNSGTFDFSAAIRADDNDGDSDGGDPFLKQLRQSNNADANVDSVGDGGDNDADFDTALRRTFAQAGQKIDNSGTFSRLSVPTKAGSGGDNSNKNNNSGSIVRSRYSGAGRHRNQNLEAAALALADPSDDEADDNLDDFDFEYDTPGGGNGGGNSSSSAHGGGGSSSQHRGGGRRRRRGRNPNSSSPSSSSSHINNNSAFLSSSSPSSHGSSSSSLQFPCGAAMNYPNSVMNNNNNGDDDDHHHHHHRHHAARMASVDGTNMEGGGKNAGSSTSTSRNGSNTNNNVSSPYFGQIPPNKTPMHAQEVALQRPLFFGPNLPPRVIDEAKRIVDKALKDQWQKHEEEQQQRLEPTIGHSDNNAYTPRLGQLPSGVRNLVSAIQCYGFGLDIIAIAAKGSTTSNSIDSSVGGTSSPYVSVFCPRWSEDCKKLSSVPPPPSTAVSTTVVNKNSASLVDSEKDDTGNATTTKSALESPIGSTGQQQQQEKEDSFDQSLSERDMFSAFARHGSDYNDTGNADADNADNSEASDDSRIIVNSSKPLGGGDAADSTAPKSPLSSNENSGNVAHDSLVDNDDDASTVPTTPKLSEQALFTQWVHGGESPANTNISKNISSSNSNSKAGGGTFNFNDSFRGMNAIVPAGGDDSDDDTVVGSEMKTKVGVNEHLNAALASLEDEQSPAEAAIESDAVAEEGGGELTQVPLTEDGGRPLSNQELMNAHAPLFGIDDPPLPSESDLGNHETREEQQRSKEQRRIQAFIEKFCPHNIFGPLACPNPATSPDDNHSWNSLSTPLQRNPNISPLATNSDHPGSTTTSPVARSICSDDLASLQSSSGYGMTAKKVSRLASTPRGYDPRTRYGWWNTPNDKDADHVNSASAAAVAKGVSVDLDESSVDNESSTESDAIQLPPVEHPVNGYPIQTGLQPSPATLHRQNRPLSELHPATSLAQALPFISDRPPSYRYLQVNTQAVAFPALVEEVEPLFCSLAIYHVETIDHSMGDRTMAPIPDLERCGKVTETLNFDLTKNPEVEKSCFSSLSPYTTDTTNQQSSHLTSCGVFPLPSNLSVNNLYAIITVGKVISEGSDFEPYLRAKSKGKDERINIENLRAKAKKASTNHGNFVMPFAFGVAPLLQVFGADVPRVPSSRAVQIPLFRFYAGNGDRQIIDHIMVMLYPRADHRASGIGGPAPLTNGGTAMLVMRNFGYLGLHEVVNGKSSLAMDRLVDFTGEMQLRRRDGDENDTWHSKSRKTAHGTVPEWQSQYEAEPTINGGRCTTSNISRPEKSYSTLNAQELAPVPLLTTPLGRPGGPHTSVSKSRTRGHSSGEDIEPYFHTSFCNELLCYPRLLRNCQKGNIVVKVEMRDIEWNSEYGIFMAHMPAGGPVVHNLRRGPFLVQGAYTSCSARRPDPHFLDEFKLKLPLLLGNTNSRCPSIFFTVYRLSFSSRKKWGLRGLGRKRLSKKFDEITGDMVGESDVVTGKDCQLIQLGCGFLPLEKRQSLLENGGHDVKISYIAKYPLQDFCDREGVHSDTLVMSDFTSEKGDLIAGDESITEDGDSQGSDRYFADTLSATSASDRDTVLSENIDDNKTKQLRKQVGMLLKVRISVQSSIHSQNGTLNEFLSQEPDVSAPLKAGGKEMISFLRSGKDAIFRQLSVSSFRTPPEDIQYEAKKLLISTVDIAKPDMCSVSDISSHLVRVCKQLWKVAVVGTGNHDITWANPAVALPLRANAFATLLQILGSSTIFFSKRGVTQLDGSGKFNLLALSRVMGLLFDEKEMFGDNYNEAVSNEFLSVLSGDDMIRKTPSKRRDRRHIRSNFEFGNGSDGVGAIINEKPSLANERTDISTSNMPSSLEKIPDKSPLSGLELREKLSNESKNQKMDTVNDFKNAMQTGNREKEYEDAIHEGQFSGNDAAAAWIIAFGGSSGGNNRRWMTAPAPGLSTIQEDAGDDEEQKSSDRKATKKTQGPLDTLDTELILSKDAEANGSKKRPVKQFRVPKRSAKPPSYNNNESLDIFDKSNEPLLDSDQSMDLSVEDTLLYVSNFFEESQKSISM